MWPFSQSACPRHQFRALIFAEQVFSVYRDLQFSLIPGNIFPTATQSSVKTFRSILQICLILRSALLGGLPVVHNLLARAKSRREFVGDLKTYLSHQSVFLD